MGSLRMLQILREPDLMPLIRAAQFFLVGRAIGQ
jgi:hypothetical protein